MLTIPGGERLYEPSENIVIRKEVQMKMWEYEFSGTCYNPVLGKMIPYFQYAQHNCHSSYFPSFFYHKAKIVWGFLLNKCLNWGATNIPNLILAPLNLWKVWRRYWKAVPFLFIALTKFFISLSLCAVVEVTLFVCQLKGYFELFSRLYHSQRKQTKFRVA